MPYILRYPLESDDPRWVGAWWIGFLFTSVLCLITVLPIVGFPNVLPGWCGNVN